MEAHLDLCLEGEVPRDGCKRGAGSEAVARRKHAAEEAGRGSESGQKEMLKAVIAKTGGGRYQRVDADCLRLQYAARERRVCGLMGMAVSSYYRTTRCDDELRTRLVELAREKLRVWLSAAAGVGVSGGRSRESVQLT